MTEVKPCDCKHAWQDAKYGKGQRVHNSLVIKAGVSVQWRCTVCGKVKQ